MVKMNPSLLPNHKLALKRERIENYVDKPQLCKLYLPFSSVVLNQETCHPGDICQHLVTFVTTGGIAAGIGGSKGQGCCQTPHNTQLKPQQQRFIWPKMSKALVDKLCF